MKKPWQCISISSGSRHQHCSRPQLSGMQRGLQGYQLFFYLQMSTLAIHFTLLNVTCNSEASFCSPLNAGVMYGYAMPSLTPWMLLPLADSEKCNMLSEGVKAGMPFHLDKTITSSFLVLGWGSVGNRGLILLVRNWCYKWGSLHTDFKFVGILLCLQLS